MFTTELTQIGGMNNPLANVIGKRRAKPRAQQSSTLCAPQIHPVARPTRGAARLARNS